jgi:hypothetical protein
MIDYQGGRPSSTIETTMVQRAVNTDKDVFKVGICIISASKASGSCRRRRRPWSVTGNVPKEIY